MFAKHMPQRCQKHVKGMSKVRQNYFKSRPQVGFIWFSMFSVYFHMVSNVSFVLDAFPCIRPSLRFCKYTETYVKSMTKYVKNMSKVFRCLKRMPRACNVCRKYGESISTTCRNITECRTYVKSCQTYVELMSKCKEISSICPASITRYFESLSKVYQ